VYNIIFGGSKSISESNDRHLWRLEVLRDGRVMNRFTDENFNLDGPDNNIVGKTLEVNDVSKSPVLTLQLFLLECSVLL